MADPIAWGLIDDLDGKVDGGFSATNTNITFVADNIYDLKTTTKENTETINGTNIKMDKLVQDVHEEIQADPTGVPAPHMAVFNLSSSKDGIKVDYTVNIGIAQNGQIPSTSGNYNYSLASVTKGVMVRYSDTHYPTNREDGDLAFIDEDVLTTQSNGQLSAKAKSQIVTANMVMNHTYYFTAFPYSKYNVYNEQLGTFNCNKAQYVGVVGSLKVSVSVDVEVKPVGEYTLTLSGGGNTYTKQSNGVGEVVFTGVKPATYNLTSSAINGYTTPPQQSVVVTEGQIKNTAIQFKNNITFSNASWSEIDAVGKSGKASSAFKIGDSKNIVVNGETITLEIVDFNHDDLTSGGKAPLSIGMKYTMKQAHRMDGDDRFTGDYEKTELHRWLNSELYNQLPSDLKSVIKKVNKKIKSFSAIRNMSTKIWMFSEKELTGTVTYSLDGEGYQYPIFANASRLRKKNSYWTRSQNKSRSGEFCGINPNGSVSGFFAVSGEYTHVCWAFCV